MLKAIIVDDEQKSRENLKILLNDFCENVSVQALAPTVKEGIEAIQEIQPDILFLDIQMNKETGFDLLKKLKKVDFEVIFTTAHSEYAIEAIKFAAIDYLLKPIDIADLRKAVSRVESKISEKKASDTFFRDKLDVLIQNFKSDSSEQYKLALPTSDGLIFINLRDILYCEAMSNYTKFHMRDNSNYLVSKTLKEYENLLIQHNFFRIHNSFLVNVREVKKYVRGEGGYVIMNNEQSLDVSKRKKEAFLNKISSTNLI